MAVVLKKKLIGSDIPSGSRFSLADVRIEASQILKKARSELDQARAEASRIVEEARKEAERVCADAHAEGKESGFAKGLDEGRAAGREEALEQGRKDYAEKTSVLQEMLSRLVADLEHQRHELISDAHQDVLALVCAIAAKVIRKTIEVDDEAVLNVVKAAVDMVAARSEIQVAMHPSDIDRLKLMDPDGAARYCGNGQVCFVGDERIECGGCVVRTAGGEIDAQIGTQINTIISHVVPNMSDQINVWSNAADETAKDAEIAGNQKSKQTKKKKQSSK